MDREKPGATALEPVKGQTSGRSKEFGNRGRGVGLLSVKRRRIPAYAVYALVITGAAMSLAMYAMVRHATRVDMVDMIVYRAEGATVRNGQNLYTMIVPHFNLAATYPPFAALLFVPTSFLSIGLLRILVTGANLGLLGLLAWLSFRLADWPRRSVRPLAVIGLVGAGVWLEPIWTTLKYGQINLLIACLVLADLTRPDHARGKGLLIGIATGLKLTPGVFGVYLLLTGRPRAALVSFAGFLGTALLGWIALPGASVSFWTHYLYDSHRVGVTQISDNQSLRGALARLLHEPDPGLSWAVLAAVTAVAGLSIAAWTSRAARCVPHAEAWGVVCTAVTALLISPISWTHHWVWCVPLLVLLAAETATEIRRPRARRHLRWRLLLAAALAVFLGYSMWIAPHSPREALVLPAWEQPPASPYVLFGVLLLAAALVRVVRRRRASPMLVRIPAQRRRSEPVLAGAGERSG
ncbi:glycosyltransferase 87 family protein [Streptacidiphilus sp. EB129]|uniref:glycosyltransferase 87 family protein n=1 Tax=Streptacidiphilus sp. EB129 TaxID=3156262 RepID=UPI003511378D